MKRILLVNNVEPFLERNRSLLNRAGFLIFTATSAKQALQIYREQAIDLVISLLDMPEMGGDTLCSLIRQSEVDNTPFLLVCYDTEAEVGRASRCGANAWLTKPVNPELLLEQVAKFLKIQARRDPRATVKAKLNGTRATSPFLGVTRNISASGFLCETSTPLNQAEIITNLLVAIDSHRVVTTGKVVRSESTPDGMYNCGVEFTRLASDSREKIESLVHPQAQGQPAVESSVEARARAVAAPYSAK